MRTTEDRQPVISNRQPVIINRWLSNDIVLNWNPLKSKRAAVESSSGAKAGFFSRRTAEKQELMGGVHELQLLLVKNGGVKQRN